MLGFLLHLAILFTNFLIEVLLIICLLVVHVLLKDPNGFFCVFHYFNSQIGVNVNMHMYITGLKLDFVQFTAANQARKLS